MQRILETAAAAEDVLAFLQRGVDGFKVESMDDATQTVRLRSRASALSWGTVVQAQVLRLHHGTRIIMVAHARARWNLTAGVETSLQRLAESLRSTFDCTAAPGSAD